MGSTGESDRKRRHVTPLSPTASSVKKQPLVQCSSSSSENKKLDLTVLQYKNQKLVQQLEVQKVEYSVLQSKFHQLKEKQKTYDETLHVVNTSWEQLVGDLEANSASTNESRHMKPDVKASHMLVDDVSCGIKSAFVNRLLETGATDHSTDQNSACPIEDDASKIQATTQIVLQNLISSINDIWCLNDKVAVDIFKSLPEDESSKELHKATSDVQLEVASFRAAVDDIHLKHRILSNKLQYHRDLDAKIKVSRRCLTEEHESTVMELEESNSKLTTLKAKRDATKEVPFLFASFGKKDGAEARDDDKQRELQDLQYKLKELTDLASSRLVEITSLHEGRLEILKKLADFKNALMDVKGITLSKPFQLLKDQLEASSSELDQCRAVLEKLQAERDKLTWFEKEVNMKDDLADIFRKVSSISESRISYLEAELRKLADEKIPLEAKIEEASREPGRQKIIAEFKALVASLPNDMRVIQSQLNEHKEVAMDIHSMRAEVQSIGSILHRKGNELESLSVTSADQLSEIKKLQAVVQELKESDQELKLILEMYRRESTDSREILQLKDMEYRAWANVRGLELSLDEHNLELRVKSAIEAEALSQQRLATTEAEIADLRQRLEASGRDICKLTEVLKSKHEEGEAYLSEIESIGQAYGDMQTQNQHLLQQITERDDYNIMIFLEGIKAKHAKEALHIELQNMDNEIQKSRSLMEIYNQKIAKLDDQLKIWSEQVGKYENDDWQNSLTLESDQKRLADAKSEYQQLKRALDEMHDKLGNSRVNVSTLFIELEKERFNKKRIEEEVDVLARKASQLSAQTEGSTILVKLRQEIREYKGILKCGICHDRQKEVVIAKCYHLFCGQCVQTTLESRHRRCPTCSSTFNPNDVKPIYI